MEEAWEFATVTWVAAAAILIVYIATFFLAFAFSIWVENWVTGNPEREVSSAAKSLGFDTNLDEQEILNVTNRIGRYRFRNPEKVNRLIVSESSYYSEVVAFEKNFPGLLGKASARYSFKNKLGNRTGLTVLIVSAIVWTYGPKYLSNVYSDEIQLSEIRSSLRSGEFEKSSLELDAKLVELSDIAIAIKNEDSMSALKVLAEDALLLAQDSSMLIEQQRENHQLALLLINDELATVEARNESLSTILQLEEVQKKSAREFYTAELVKASWQTFWLGIFVAIIIQVAVTLIFEYRQKIKTLPHANDREG